MGEQETIQEVGARLVAIHGAGHVCAVPYAGGVAFFRRPTPEEHDAFVVYADADEAETKGKAIRVYVKSCFCEALDGSTFEQACEKAGPVWHRGPALKAVNKLSGATEVAPTTFF